MPRKLLGQSLLAVALALLVGQAFTGFVFLRASEDRRDVATVNALALNLLRASDTGSAQDRAVRRAIRREMREREPDGVGSGGQDLGRPGPRRLLPPRLAGRVEPVSPLMEGENRDTSAEERLHDILSRQGVVIGDLVVTTRSASRDPLLGMLLEARPALRERGLDQRSVVVAGLRLPDRQDWIVARTVPPPIDQRGIRGIVVQTLILFLALLGATYLVLRRITRPLGQLTERVDRFAQTHEAQEPLSAKGPEDVSRLITVHNAMEERISALIAEKDVMLGAIGHDLKTPLAALRVRIESVEDPTQRQKMAEGIEDLTRSLDDILSLARIGRARDPAEPTQLAALVESVVEEFEDMERPVTLAQCERVVVPLHVTWVRRALRNLIENGLRYGERVTVTLRIHNGEAFIDVEDEGPGIPEGDIAQMFEPFRRGETSRNRSTGGAGLGLTIARAIARDHGGSLTLANREEGGLRASLTLPRA